MKKTTARGRVAKIVDWRLEQLNAGRFEARLILESLAADAYNLGKSGERREGERAVLLLCEDKPKEFNDRPGRCHAHRNVPLGGKVEPKPVEVPERATHKAPPLGPQAYNKPDPAAPACSGDGSGAGKTSGS